jgi:hypothetical protein
MSHVKSRVVSLGLSVAVAAAATGGVAQANSTNVVTAIKSQDKVIKRSPAYKELQHFDVKTKTQARTLLKSFSALQREADHAASVVAAASTSSARQKSGQRDWVNGMREGARGIGQFETGIKDLLAGKKTDAKQEVVRAEKTLKAGNALGSKGDKLLGLPTRD